ncbi:MAG: sigma 54-interacting transcriptional regulator [Bacteroidota bacterium]
MSALTTSSEQIQTFIAATELSDRGVIFLNKKGVVIGLNKVFAEHTAYAKEEVLGKMIFEINPHLSMMAWRKLWGTLQREGRLSVKGDHLTATDELRPVNVRWERVEINNEVYGCGVVEDLISASRYEDLLNIASEISKVAAWEWDVLHQELFFSQQFFKLLNLPEDFQLTVDKVEFFLSQTLTAQSAKDLLTTAREKVKSGQPFDLELNLRPRGNTIPAAINLTAQPLVIENRTVKLYGIIQDLSSVSGRTEELFLTNFCMDYALDSILWLDKTGKIIYANQSATITYDFSKEAFKEQSIFQLSSKHTPEGYPKWWAALSEKGIIEFESIHQTSSGRHFPVWVSHNYIPYRDKGFDCVFIKDLTDQKIQENQWRLTQQTVDKAQDMIFWLDEKGNYIYVNEKACQTLGYSRDELQSKSVFDTAKDFSQADWEHYWSSVKENGYVELENVHYTKDNQAIPVRINANYVEYNEQPICCAFLKNLSFRKRRDEQIKLSMSTIEWSSDMIFWLDAEGTIFYANRRAITVLGYSKDQLIGLPLFKIAPERNKAEWPNHFAQMRKRQNHTYESLIKRKNGKIFPVEVTVNYIKHGDKEILSVYAKDITERRQKKIQLELAYEQIKELKEEAETENTILKDEIQLEYGFANIISESPNYRVVLKKVEQVASSDATVLILGETGTGKELLARAVHELSGRSNKAMIKVNCGALPANLIESELFGHEKGAFTGAHQSKKGRFELAHKGTIFLDEIGELPLDLQTKLLRVLQEGEFEKLGGTQTVKVDVRVIAATNRDLEQKVEENAFREDLFYRLNVFPIQNIPLRERKDDIVPLVRFFVEKYSKKMGKDIKEIPQRAIKRLKTYDFPGNVRELENIIERSIILSTDNVLRFDTSLFRSGNKKESDFLSLDDMQRQHIIEALKRTKGRISGEHGAATILQINDKTLTSRMKKLGVKRSDYLG